MSHKISIKDKKIWLTRPKGQSDELQKSLNEMGAEVRLFPLLTIVKKDLDSASKEIVMNLDNYDLIFYISSNAARIGLDVIDDYWPQYPSGILNFSVGPTTAKVLTDAGLKVFYPSNEMSTEALLDLPELSNIAGRKVLIIKGEGGRELLAQALSERGSNVTELALYRRDCPVYDSSEICQSFMAQPPDYVIISSSEALDNLLSIFIQTRDTLFNVSLLVSSSRIADKARAEGFNDIFVLPGATDNAIMASMQK